MSRNCWASRRLVCAVDELALRRKDRVIILRHSCCQAAPRHFDSRLRNRLRRERPADLAVSKQREKLLVNDCLLVIDVHAVIGHEHAGRRAVAFGVDELVECIQRRQRGGLCLHAVFPRQRGIQIRALDLGSVLLRSLKRVRQGDYERSLCPGAEDDAEEYQGTQTCHACVQWSIMT